MYNVTCIQYWHDIYSKLVVGRSIWAHLPLVKGTIYIYMRLSLLPWSVYFIQSVKYAVKFIEIN